MEWISVKDRLPKDEEILCVCVKDCERKELFISTAVFWNTMRECWSYMTVEGTKDISDTHCVTHWIPLPDLPKEYKL